VRTHNALRRLTGSGETTMTDTRTRDHEHTLDDVIALEDALEQKDTIKEQRTESDPRGLYARLKQEEAAERAERVRHLTSSEKLLARMKEFFGRGPEFEYHKHLNQVEHFYTHMTVVSKNLEEKITDIGKQKVTAEKQLILDEAELQTNAVIAFHYERQLADTTTRYEAAKTGTASRIPATTDAMENVQEITRLRQSLSEVHAENNRLAIRILSGREIVRNLGTQYDHVQHLYQGFEEQRVRAEGSMQLAQIHGDALKGVSDSKSVSLLYKQTGAAVEVMMRMQKELKLDAIENLPVEYRVPSPSAKHKPVAGKQYWQTLDLFPSRTSKN